jgi:histidinol-phosphate aminotransferase
MDFNLQKLVRDNIKNLKPYSSARQEFTGQASIFLDANENAYGSPLTENYSRYPDPLQWQLKFQLARIKGVPAENICIGNGSDEIIDLAYRIFCNPGKDNVIICPPTYGMYAVSASINDIEIKKVDLTEKFQLDVKGIMDATNENSKILFICSPNNPTGNNMIRSDIEYLLKNFPGVIIIDEAYINYSSQNSFIQELPVYPNLIVMQTLSKAWGMAALRIGLCYASLDIIDLFNKIKPPYNINEASQVIALQGLQQTIGVNAWIKETVLQKDKLMELLSQFIFIKNVYPSDANFILIRVENGDKLYNYLSQNEIIIRNRSQETGCANCLRITVGTTFENNTLLNALKNYALL